MPKGLCTHLTVLSAARSTIVNFRRDAARGGQRLLELRQLLDWHEVILGPGKDENIALDPLGDASERVLLLLNDRVEWMFDASTCCC